MPFAGFTVGYCLSAGLSTLQERAEEAGTDRAAHPKAQSKSKSSHTR